MIKLRAEEVLEGNSRETLSTEEGSEGPNGIGISVTNIIINEIKEKRKERKK